MPKNKKYEPNEKDFEFMNSLSSAILSQSNKKIDQMVKLWLFTIIIAIGWASFASIDEITRGSGKVIPYGENQIIQNLEGGIIQDIKVKEGDFVKKGEVLLKIKNSISISEFNKNELKYNELKAKEIRLNAESHDEKFVFVKTNNENFKHQQQLSLELYESNKREYLSKDRSLKEKITQKIQSYKETKAKIKTLNKSLNYVIEEIQITEPMVKEGVKSKIDFLKLKKEENQIENKIEVEVLSLPRLKSEIREAKEKREENKITYMNKAKKELNKITAELNQIKSANIQLKDKVKRTNVLSPVTGIVQKLFIHTVGGVVKSGEDLIEIVPTNKKLYLEIKIKPSDIAFIRPGIEVKVKLSAYDFSIYGGLVGKVINISPDTVTDKDETYYLIHVETDRNYLGTEKNKLKIIPGMLASVDIITGKKTILQYILKPILKSKQYMFTEK